MNGGKGVAQNRGTVLAVDVGGGTQDILLWDPAQLVENAYKLVMPSPTVLVSREIARHTEWGRDICLVGRTMGGGACGAAVRAHLEAGCRVYALREPALSLNDNIERVAAMGVRIVSEPPPEAARVVMGDLDVDRLGEAFGLFGLALPETIAVAVQDHGYSPNESNRLTRMRYWRQNLDSGGDLEQWVDGEPPEFMTRMIAVKKSSPGAIVLDTGIAAILGALLDPRGRSWNREGLTVVNIGNFHTVAALVCADRIFAVYEHHTGLLDSQRLSRDLDAFRERRLTHEEVFSANGHGCAYADDIPPLDFHHLLVTGPRRRLFSLPGQHAAAPFGDMMLTGCFGLVRAACRRHRRRVDEFM